MTNPNLGSNVSIRITLAYLEFLSCVQCSNEVEKAKLENLKESIMSVFKISPSMIEATRMEADEQNGRTFETSNTAHMPPSASLGSAIRMDKSLLHLFHEFHMAVAAIGFFEWLVGGDCKNPSSHVKLIFKDAIAVLKRAGHQTFNRRILAEGLKILGNHAMRYRCYDKAIAMYNCALALHKDNAIYFCNRALAFINIGKFNEAISDCYQAIKLEPKYVLPFYRIGCAYYERGSYLEAIREGFLKVLQLNPHHEEAKDSLQLADSELKYDLAEMREQINSYMRNGVTRPADNGPMKLVEEKWDTSDDDGDILMDVDFNDDYVP